MHDLNCVFELRSGMDAVMDVDEVVDDLGARVTHAELEAARASQDAVDRRESDEMSDEEPVRGAGGKERGGKGGGSRAPVRPSSPPLSDAASSECSDDERAARAEVLHLMEHPDQV